MRAYVNDAEYGRGDCSFGDESSEHGMDSEIVGSDLWSGGVESYDAFFSVYFAEHCEHVF